MILIVEDNRDVNQMLAEALHTAGYQTESTYTGVDAVKIIKENKYEMILLDLMLPYQSGDQVLEEIRSFCDVPVIVISAKGTVDSKIDLLKLGADDYITKPFDLQEVIARIETNLRRFAHEEKKTHKITYKNLTLDCDAKKAEVSGKEIELAKKEFLILEALVKSPEKVFTKSALYEMIWQEEYYGDDNTIKAHFSKLRSKLKRADNENEYIETVWGLGYRLNKS